MEVAKVAIVGAGLAGLTCANILSKNKLEVSLFDKGRHPGGRLASRDRNEDTFDYGAQYLTTKDLRFVQFLAPLLHDGKLAKWNGIFKQMTGGVLSQDVLAKPRFVGVPSMRSIADTIALTENLDCKTSHRVTKVFKEGGKWFLEGVKVNLNNEEEYFTADNFDFLVLNMPPAQASALYPHEELEDLELMPCCALLLTFSERLRIDCDGVALDDEVISWVARDSSKPGRPSGERWVIHASPEWSAKNFNLTIEEIEKILLARFASVFNIELPEITFQKTHKWKYALPTSPPSWGCLQNEEESIIYCGDWCVSGRVEGAFLSGHSAAEEILEVYSKRMSVTNAAVEGKLCN